MCHCCCFRRKLQEAFLAESADYEPAHLSKGRVNEENWQSLIGVDHPPPGPPDFSKPPKPTHYADFQEFFQSQIAAKGAAEVVKMVRSRALAAVALPQCFVCSGWLDQRRDLVFCCVVCLLACDDCFVGRLSFCYADASTLLAFRRWRRTLQRESREIWRTPSLSSATLSSFQLLTGNLTRNSSLADWRGCASVPKRCRA